MKISSILSALLLFAATILGQSDYSDSTPFKPRTGDSKTRSRGADEVPQDKDKKAVPQLVSVDSGVGVVTIPIFVEDASGTPVTDLTVADVKVFVNDSPVPIKTLDKAPESPVVILVLDTSPSVDPTLKTLKAHATKFVDLLPESTKVVVVEFSSGMNVLCQLTGDRAELRKCISKAEMGDGTSIYSAISVLFEKVLPLIPGRKSMVIFSDGVDTTSRRSTYGSSLGWVERSDVPIFAFYYDSFQAASRSRNVDDWIAVILGNPNVVGTSRTGSTAAELQTGRDYLADLTSASGGRVVSTKKLKDDDVKRLVNAIRAGYYASIEVPKADAARHQIKVRVNRPNLVVRARGSVLD